ncbi:MAG: PHP domain-containing protein, partial [Pseudomonadota bacterium]
MSPYDLHCHSRVSDGTLSPRELVQRAHEQGVKVLALTDHDDVRGLAEARKAAGQYGIELVPGVEVSVTWGGNTVHIVGLKVDPEHAAIVAGLERNRAGRAERARKIAEALAKLGIAGALEGAYAFAENKELIGRS